MECDTLHASRVAVESRLVAADDLYMSKGCGAGGWALLVDSSMCFTLSSVARLEVLQLKLV